LLFSHTHKFHGFWLTDDNDPLEILPGHMVLAQAHLLFLKQDLTGPAYNEGISIFVPSGR
jgi:hypothetical protein